jgi:[glutamine synthetase] adenylyltransferase / [glutamine synthetase]-adenylyl-L-tyrosine phosphorylase
MSLPLLVELPPSLVSLAERAEQSLQTALAEHQALAERVAAWPQERRNACRR